MSLRSTHRPRKLEHLYKSLAFGLTTYLFLSSTLTAQNHSSLLQNSPFLPPDYNKAAALKAAPKPPPQAPLRAVRELEFRGIFKIGDALQFSIFDKKDQKSSWMKIGETVSDIRIQEYSPEAQTITVQIDSQTEILKLKEMSSHNMPTTAPQINTASQTGASIASQANATSNARRATRRPRRRRIIPNRQRTTTEAASSIRTSPVTPNNPLPPSSPIPPGILEALQKKQRTPTHSSTPLGTAPVLQNLEEEETP